MWLLTHQTTEKYHLFDGRKLKSNPPAHVCVCMKNFDNIHFKRNWCFSVAQKQWGIQTFSLAVQNSNRSNTHTHTKNGFSITSSRYQTDSNSVVAGVLLSAWYLFQLALKNFPEFSVLTMDFRIKCIWNPSFARFFKILFRTFSDDSLENWAHMCVAPSVNILRWNNLHSQRVNITKSNSIRFQL